MGLQWDKPYTNWCRISEKTTVCMYILLQVAICSHCCNLSNPPKTTQHWWMKALLQIPPNRYKWLARGSQALNLGNTLQLASSQGLQTRCSSWWSSHPRIWTHQKPNQKQNPSIGNMGLSENRVYPQWNSQFLLGNSVPLNPMVLLIIIPFLNGYFIGNIPYFQTKPYGGFLSHRPTPSHHPFIDGFSPQKKPSSYWGSSSYGNLQGFRSYPFYGSAGLIPVNNHGNGQIHENLHSKIKRNPWCWYIKTYVQLGDLCWANMLGFTFFSTILWANSWDSFLHGFSDDSRGIFPPCHVWFGVHFCPMEIPRDWLQVILRRCPTTSCQEVIGLLGSLA